MRTHQFEQALMASQEVNTLTAQRAYQDKQSPITGILGVASKPYSGLTQWDFDIRPK